MLQSWLSRLQATKWMNHRAGPNSAYVPTQVEHYANIVTHGVWIVPSIFGWWTLAHRCTTPVQFLAASLYGCSLFLLFAVSTCFHSVFMCSNQGGLKDVMHRCDRAVIYIFIAGSYFPWTMLIEFPENSISCHVCWIIWVLATCGICYQQLFHERFKTIETIFYCCMGVLPALMLTSQVDHVEGYDEMRVGGALYLLGVLFFKADGCIPFAHAIWHCFVAAAACLHYLTIATYLFPHPKPLLSHALEYLNVAKVDL